MNSDLERQACTRRCWWMGGGVGLVLAFLLLAFGGWGFFGAVFVGLIVAAIVGWLLGMFLCSAADTHKADPAPRSQAAGAADASTTMAAGAGAAVASSDRPKPKAADVGTTSPTEFVSETPETDAPVAKAPDSAAKPSAAKSGLKPKAAAGKTAASSAGAATAASDPVVETPAPKGAATAKRTPAKRAPAAKTDDGAADKAATPASTKAPKQPRRAVATDGKPEMLTAARAGGADNLKLISGVGPKLEQTLNELGVYHFDQVASWRKKEIEWVDARLRFKGRIERDDWISQAKTLAKGGETEFSRKKS